MRRMCRRVIYIVCARRSIYKRARLHVEPYAPFPGRSARAPRRNLSGTVLRWQLCSTCGGSFSGIWRLLLPSI